ncbi:RDD family protein [Corynebacterium sp. H127]|uniref:RDD family protein n=1 Tax=Corynebacterium sp. H127 TaxID=3133418 RepID=UPI0030AC4BB3
MAYGILAHPEQRATYDQALESGRPLGDYELEHLANFGSWPLLPPQQPAKPTPQPQPQPSQYARPQPAPPTRPINPNPAVNPFASANQYQQQQTVPVAPHFAVPVAPMAPNRPSPSARVGMTLLDGLIALAIVGTITSSASMDSFIGVLASALIILVYYLGFEVKFGATPAKLMLGYTVRDVNTGQKLSLEHAAKRNWWRLVAMVPGVGTVVSFIAACIYASTISESNGRQGAHDRIANAEVVKKDSPL